MAGLYFERFLLVAGDQDTGKSTQLRSMFLDPRINDDRIGPKRTVPNSRNIPETYELSHGRSLYLRLTSPHEYKESIQDFFYKVTSKCLSGRWCVASPVQITPTDLMPDLPTTVTAIARQFSPERIRVCFLSPDYHGISIPNLQDLTSQLQAIPSCEVISIDARDRQANGLLLADTFDFT